MPARRRERRMKRCRERLRLVVPSRRSAASNRCSSTRPAGHRAGPRSNPRAPWAPSSDGPRGIRPVARRARVMGVAGASPRVDLRSARGDDDGGSGGRSGSRPGHAIRTRGGASPCTKRRASRITTHRMAAVYQTTVALGRRLPAARPRRRQACVRTSAAYLAIWARHCSKILPDPGPGRRRRSAPDLEGRSARPASSVPQRHGHAASPQNVELPCVAHRTSSQAGIVSGWSSSSRSWARARYRGVTINHPANIASTPPACCWKGCLLLLVYFLLP